MRLADLPTSAIHLGPGPTVNFVAWRGWFPKGITEGRHWMSHPFLRLFPKEPPQGKRKPTPSALPCCWMFAGAQNLRRLSLGCCFTLLLWPPLYPDPALDPAASMAQMATAKPALPGRLNEIKTVDADQKAGRSGANNFWGQGNGSFGGGARSGNLSGPSFLSLGSLMLTCAL